MKPYRKKKKIKYIVGAIAVIACLILTALALMRGQKKEEIAGISSDAALQPDLQRISFLSQNGVFRYSNIENNLEAYYQHQEFYEAVSRALRSIDRDCTGYQREESGMTDADEIYKQMDGHYVMMEFGTAHSIDFSENPNLKMTQIRCILYNAENGDLWFGNDSRSLKGYARLDDTDEGYTPDENFLSIIEGKGEKKDTNMWEGIFDALQE